tara:strand:+ start:1411 stop:2052 length:642 start_codon:yes stop_codon:yes gene_type:complete
MNYTQLVADVQSYSENQFTTTDINTFITQAEERVFNSVQLPDLRRNQVGTTSTGNKYLSAPGDWLATYSLAVVNAENEYLYLLNKDVNFIRQSFPDTDPAFYGKPEYYALFDDDTFILGPTPDNNYTVELHYFYYPTSITTAVSGTSWLGDNFSSVLLYGTLLEAATFMMQDEDIVATYNKRYDSALSMLKQLGDGKNRQDSYRSGQVRYDVK